MRAKRLPRQALRCRSPLRPGTLLQAGVPALTTKGKTQCTGRPVQLLRHRRLVLHHHRPRHLHQLLPHLPWLPPGALLMIPGPAWFRPGPCPGRPPLPSVLLRHTQAAGRPDYVPTLALPASSRPALRRTPTTPPRPTTMQGHPTCTISRHRCTSLLLCSWRLLRLHHRLLHLHQAGTNLRSCRP